MPSALGVVSKGSPSSPRENLFCDGCTCIFSHTNDGSLSVRLYSSDMIWCMRFINHLIIKGGLRGAWPLTQFILKYVL